MAHTEGSKLAMKQANPKKCVVVRIESATRLHEVGIASNLVNQNVTVNTFRALYTPPVTPWEWAAKEVGSLTFRGGTLTTLWFMTGVKS